MSGVSRILVVKLSSLGDLFHAVPIVHRLKQTYQCPIDWVTQPEYVDLVRCHQDVDRVIPYPRKGGLKAWKAFIRDIRKDSYDLAIDLQGLTKSGVAMGLAVAERKIASSRHRELSRFFANEIPLDTDPGPHARDGLMDTLRFLDIDPEPVVYPLSFPQVEFPGDDGYHLAIAPKSRWPAKDWPLDQVSALVGRLRRQHDWSVWVVGGPNEREAGERLVRDHGDKAVTNLCGTHPLLELGGWLKHMTVLVTPDTGPMHFAAAVGTPLVALFGPTDPARTGPLGDHVKVIRPKAGPEGYPDHRSYKNGNTSMMESITVETVAREVEKILAAHTSGKSP